MAKRNEPLKIERVFVHYDKKGQRIERKECEIPEVELKKLKVTF